MSGNIKKAIYYGIFLCLANYSVKKIRDFGPLAKLINTSDYDFFKFEMKKHFKVPPEKIDSLYSKLEDHFQKFPKPYHILHVEDKNYPKQLKSVPEPPVFLFCRGNLDLLNKKTIAVVGSRAASENGLRRAKKLGRLLTRHGYTVVSGLAKGIDAMGHLGAIEEGGQTISVIGTPLDKSYPKENRKLQEQIATDHLLVSQYHFGHPVNQWNFPRRNYTMSGISYATIIVEAGETSGTLTQARHCIAQGRHLFLLKNLLDRKDLDWPKKYVNKGAFVISDIEDVAEALQQSPLYRSPGKEKTLFD